MEESGVIQFGEFLQDQPALGSTGATVAKNVIPAAKGYRCFRSLASLSAAATAKILGMFAGKDDSGTTALYVDSPLERAHRDIYAVGQHMILASAWLEQAGRVSFKLAPTHPLFSR